MKKEDWVWMPHPGHFIGAKDCKFHLTTYVGGYIVSTVGEYWPDRKIREIHAECDDKKWWEKNKSLKGDDFENAYYDKFGFIEIGCNRTYETMVFTAKEGDLCCPYRVKEWSELDFQGYNDPGKAYRGHMELCEKWSKKDGNNDNR